MDAEVELEGYEVLRELGRGAMGVVYLARDRVLEREVALKVLAEESTDEPARERFLHEARAMARLSHPNVVTVYRAGVAASGPYLVMELLHGRSLDVALEQGGALDAASLLRVGLEAARGLAAAHARGIVHRDIKPSNLFETQDGTVKVLDFGIAKILGVPVPAPAAPPPALASSSAPQGAELVHTVDGSLDAALAATAAPEALAQAPFDATIDASSGEHLVPTRPGQSPTQQSAATRIGGTPLYMAPEVWRQEASDHASDVWSLGATLFHLATGQPPFLGRNIAEIAYNVMVATPAQGLASKREDLPPAFCALVDRALAKNRARRFASAGEFLAELELVVRAQQRERLTLEGSPYPGLRSMGEGDRARFFGREEDAVRVLERLRAEAFVVLVGPSGTGKSSLAAAGVAPAVAEGAAGGPATWRVLRCSPGRAPVQALATALATVCEETPEELRRTLLENADALARVSRAQVARLGQGMLLLVDQLEELVTLAEESERDAAAAALGRLVELCPAGVRVLATARSDLFDRLGGLGHLGALLGRGTELVRPLTGASLRAAIVEPARAAGARFESDALVESVLAEVGSGEGALPLVAFAMSAWWEKRDRATQTLTARAWHEVGGVAGALGAHAEAVYSSLAEEDRKHARPLLLALLNADGTRRYATRAQLQETLGDPSAAERVLGAFDRARLVSVQGQGEDARATVIHEALVRAWPRLEQWLNEGRDDRVLQERLENAASVWVASGKPSELLWRGALLEDVLRWRVVYDDLLSEQGRAFVDASVRARVRTRVAVGAALLAGALLAGGLTASAWRRAFGAESALAREREEARAVLDSARGDAYQAALGMARALREEDPAASLGWLVAASQLRGYASTGARAMAMQLDARGIPVRFDCRAPVATVRSQGRFACAVGDTIVLAELATGDLERVPTQETPTQVAVAREAQGVVAWIDTQGDLWLRDPLRGPRRVREQLRGRPVLALNPTGTQLALLYRSTGQLVVLTAEGVSRVVAERALEPAAIQGVTVEHLGSGLVLSLTGADGSTRLWRWAIPPEGGAPGNAATHELAAVLAERQGELLHWVDAEGQLRGLDLGAGSAWHCPPVSTTRARSLTYDPRDGRLAWLSAPPPPQQGLPPAPATVHWLDGSCEAHEASAGQAVQLAPSPQQGGLFVLDRDGALSSLTLATGAWEPRSRGGEPVGEVVEVLGAGGGVVWLRGREEDGRAVTRGLGAWQGSFGLRHERLREVLVDGEARRIAVLDSAHRVLVYRRPERPELLQSRWLEAPSATGGEPVAAWTEEGALTVAAARVGVRTMRLPSGEVLWRRPAEDSTAVALTEDHAALGFADGHVEWIDLRTRREERVSALRDAVPVHRLALSEDGLRLSASSANGASEVHERGAAGGWRRLDYRPFSELDAPTALAVSRDWAVVAGRRLGFVSRGGLTTLASTPGDFYDRRVTSLALAGGSSALLTTDDCAAWSAYCEGSERCSLARRSEAGEACVARGLQDQLWLAAAPAAGLQVVDALAGVSGLLVNDKLLQPREVLLGEARSLALRGRNLAAVGSARTPWLATLEVPPEELEAFQRWVAVRSNALVSSGGGLRLVVPVGRLP